MRRNMSKSKNAIFLSYSHHDQSWVKAFVEQLTKNQVDVWYDQQAIRAGDRWQELIQDALRKSSILVAVLSKDSVKRPWMFFELGAAVADGKTVIPVLIEGLDFRDLPSLIAQFQAVSASDPAEAGEIVSRVIADLAKQGQAG
ncbi:MAG: toll/interleukin-1 receptor domain-containing protein [Planctomycetota bacterium]